MDTEDNMANKLVQKLQDLGYENIVKKNLVKCKKVIIFI